MNHLKYIDTIAFLKRCNISYEIINNKFIINIPIFIYHFYSFSALDNCIFNENLQFSGLNSNMEIPDNFLKNIIVKKDLFLNNLEYLPKGFCPDVRGIISAPKLKSKTLRDLILNPGPNRQLGFNLLKI